MTLLRVKSCPTPAVFYGLTAQRIAAVCGVSVATVRAYLRGSRKPSRQVLRLVTLYREELVLEGRAWAGWRVRGNKLVDPAGYVFTASVLEGYQSLLQWAHGMAYELGRREEYWAHLDVLGKALRETR
jgi:Phage protein/Helix-turn-helix